MTINWRKIYRRVDRTNMVFLVGVGRGLPLLEAYRNSSEQRADATPAEMRATLARLLAKYRDLIGPLLDDKQSRLDAIALTAEAAIEDQLRSGDAKERNEGVKNARAVCGMDAPTKTHNVIESPHLDNRPLTPLVPARERFGGEN